MPPLEVSRGVLGHPNGCGTRSNEEKQAKRRGEARRSSRSDEGRGADERKGGEANVGEEDPRKIEEWAPGVDPSCKVRAGWGLTPAANLRSCAMALSRLAGSLALAGEWNLFRYQTRKEFVR